MSKLSICDSKTMIKILMLLGFKELRQKGSHKFFINDKGLTTVIPVHN
ncbi:type II toxin-antitoxin system HicA family toxin [Brachyspira innocens]|nr:type II toxin-antitoxin system HicA family toxin [Brachyspira innocens]MDO6994321.1 type II toxin-antitoxin system HicA family toxin [Brachyspira innocens]MDO7020333.1 type II toxin-antitoxin system HicA family toxin [Brachyspira innocens]